MKDVREAIHSANLRIGVKRDLEYSDVTRDEVEGRSLPAIGSSISP